MDSCDEISTKDELTSQELRLSRKIILLTAKPAQKEELRVGDGELRVRREIKREREVEESLSR